MQYFALHVFQHASRNDFFAIFVVFEPIGSPLGCLGGVFFNIFGMIFWRSIFRRFIGELLGGAGGRGAVCTNI